MPNPMCFVPADICLIRFAALDSSGHPDEGANKGYATDTVVSLTPSLDIEEGEENIQKNGCGNIVASFKEADRYKSISFEMEIANIDAHLGGLLIGEDVFTSGGNSIGGRAPAIGATTPNGVCVEAWQKLYDGGGLAVPAFTTPNAAFLRWVFPKVRWVRGGDKMEAGLQLVTLQGVGEENGALTVDGPFNDYPAAVKNNTPVGGTPRLYNYFIDPSTAVPTTVCGPITVPVVAS